MAFGFLEYALVLLALLVALFAYGKWRNKHFKRKGIPYIEPPVPFVGMGLNMLLQTEHVSDMVQRIYDKFPNEKYFGTFEGPRPLIVLKDLDLIKQLCVKDFDVFNGHRTIIDGDTDPIYGNFLIILKGEKWHDMRSNLSPAFTSSKMKNMFEFVDECARQMANNYIEKFASEKTDVIDIEAKEALSYFTNDVIATAIFGLKINSMANPDCEFYKMGKKSADFSGIQLLKMFAHYFMPKIMNLLDIPLIRKDIKDYFSNLVLGTMAEREKHGIIRHDMIHLLMEAKKGSLRHEASSKELAGYATVEESNIGRKKVDRQWTDYELVSQAMIFYMAGFDTTSTMLTFLMYELARNPDIQERLQEEIDNFKLESGGTLTYNDLPKLKYMDMVVSESMRLWPSLPLTDRVATRSYTIPPPSDSNINSYEIKANESIWIPSFSIQRDPKYFPNPLKFDPERFSEENKQSIQPGSYLPFGLGPRNCIGSRFALMVVKAAVFSIMGNFDIVVTAKTQIPLKIAKNSFNMNVEKGMWVGLKLRTPR